MTLTLTFSAELKSVETGILVPRNDTVEAEFCVLSPSGEIVGEEQAQSSSAIRIASDSSTILRHLLILRKNTQTRLEARAISEEEEYKIGLS